MTDYPYPFLRIHSFVFSRVLSTPNSIAWYLRKDDALVPISYQLLGAGVFHLYELFQHLHSHTSILPSSLPNSFSYVCLELACNALSKIHATFDRRLSNTQRENLITQIESKRPLIDVAYLRQIILYDQTSQACLVDDAVSLCDVSNAATCILDVDLALMASAQAIIDHRLADLNAFIVHHVETYCTLSCGEAKAVSVQPAAIMHTSGSTLQPKAVVLSHGNLISNAYSKLDAMPQFDTDRRLNLLPFSHAYARTCELSTWAIAGGSICCAASFEQAIQIALELKPTLFNAVPSTFDRIYQTTPGWQFNREQLLGGELRMTASGGAGLSEELYHAYAAIGLPIYQGYGLTETSPVVCSNRFGQSRPGSVGPTVEGVEVKLDEQGQLLVRGPNVMLGYYNNSPATDARFVDGWLATGDLAEPLENGHWRILGRIDDQISLPNGYKLNPLELEAEWQIALEVRRFAICYVQDELRALIQVDNEENVELLIQQIPAVQSRFASYARVKKAAFLSLENVQQLGLLNFKGQWKRSAVHDFLSSSNTRLFSLAGSKL